MSKNVKQVKPGGAGLSYTIVNGKKCIDYYESKNKEFIRQKIYDLMYNNIFNRLKNIILKLYKWKTPGNISARCMELGLLSDAYLCAFNGPEGTFILPGAPIDRWTVYGDPQQMRVHAFNGDYEKTVDILYDFEDPIKKVGTISTKYEGVFMRDNDTAYAYINYVKDYARRLTDKLIASENAFQRLKYPFIVSTNIREMDQTIEEFYDDIVDNKPLIVRLNPTMSEKDAYFEVQDLDCKPEILPHMRSEIQATFNEFLETIGLNTNPSPDKSQVVLTPEIESNNSLIDIEQDVRFLNRKQFCEDCKKIGIDISVEKNINEAKMEANKLGKELGGENDNIDRK